MRKLITLGAVASLLVVGIATMAPPASAATQCTGLLTGTINGDVYVPYGATCYLRATVNGNIYVNPSGWLDSGFASGGPSTVNGSVYASNPRNVIFLASTITGSITITGLTGGGCSSGLGGNTINGSVTYSNSAPGSSFFETGGGTCGGGTFGNNIGQSVIINGNRGQVQLNGDGPGGGNTIHGNVTINGNTGGGVANYNNITGSMTCNNNSPAYTAVGNTTGGTNSCI